MGRVASVGKSTSYNNMLMNKLKSLYEAPTTDVLVVRFEGAILTGSITTQSKTMPSFIEDAEEDW